MFYALTDGDNNVVSYPYTLTDLKLDNPGISFPKTITDELAETFNVFAVQPSAAPAYSNQTQSIQQINPTFDGSVWREAWETIELSAEDIASRTESQAASVREERVALLIASDWSQLPDSPADSAAWATYRQQLRDIPDQAGFPFDVVWPDYPEGYIRS